LSSQIMVNLNLSLSKIRQSISKKLGVSLNPNHKKGARGRTTPPPTKAQNSQSKTPTLDTLARDLTKAAREDRLDPIVGRESEVRRLTQILSRRTKNNPVLVGEPGVG